MVGSKLLAATVVAIAVWSCQRKNKFLFMFYRQYPIKLDFYKHLNLNVTTISINVDEILQFYLFFPRIINILPIKFKHRFYFYKIELLISTSKQKIVVEYISITVN